VTQSGTIRVNAYSSPAVEVQLWRKVDGGNELVEAGLRSIRAKIEEPGRYGILVWPVSFPVRTDPDLAVIEFDLETSFE